MRSKEIVVAILTTLLVFTAAAPAAAQEAEESRAEPAPGMAIMAGGGPFYSVPCRCVDRGVWSAQWLGRLHFGDMAALEAGIHNGTMVLGGRFPSRGWSAGGQVALLPQSDDRWWDGLSAKAGYRRWQVSGMRASGTHGMYGGLNWAVEVVSHVYLEADATLFRGFRHMPHFSMTGSLGVGFRL